jgi:5-methyltetrahydrofolate--homocysteine methyltransferase
MEIIEEIYNKVVEGNISGTETLVKEALNKKIAAQNIMNDGFIRALNLVGEKFSAGEAFLTEMLTSAMAVKSGMEILKPLLVKSDIKSKGTVVAGTVAGDIHDIGKNMVCMMLEGAGFKVIDLGVDVSREKFLQAAKENKADIVAISALLSTTMRNMAEMVRLIGSAGLEHKVNVLIGGAPVTQDFAQAIGADGYAPDAALAVKKAKELLHIS